MIKDVMVRLEGSAADLARLEAAADIVRQFEGYLIGLFLHILPPIVPPDPEGLAVTPPAPLAKEAREVGDKIAELLAARLDKLGLPGEIRRFDIFANEIASVSAREARSADVFVALRPNSPLAEPERVVETVLFGSGRHLFLIPPDTERTITFEKILLAWNGSREAARALGEALPYLRMARSVTICVVENEPPVEEEQAMLGAEAKRHLEHHGIVADLHHVYGRERDVAAMLIAEADRRNANLIVMGGYGHSRLREWLLGGVTYKLLHQAPLPLLLAH